MPTDSRGTFSHPISSEKLMSGLRKELSLARDKDYLVQSDYAVGYAGSLASIPDLRPQQLDLTGIESLWPFPQIVQCRRMTFVFTNTAIYMLANGNLELMWSGASVYNQWAVADYITYVIMSNGVVTLRYDAASNAIAPVEPYDPVEDAGTPHFAACVNYNGQLLIGGVNNGNI